MTYAATQLRLDEHRDALGRLWVENLSDARIGAVVPKRMRWLYEEAPLAPATTVVCLHVESGEVVGCGSFLERATWVDGRSVRSGVLCDFAVARMHRVGGAALAIQRELVRRAAAAELELLYGYPNRRSVPVFQRLGYRAIGETTTWVKPLRSGYKLRELLPRARLSRAAAAPVDLALRALDGARSLGARARYRGAPFHRPDARADALWERARDQYGVVADKSSAYLDWRYRAFTTAEHRMFGLHRRSGGEFCAYAIYTVDGRTATLRDVFADRLDATAAPLLLALACHLRREGLDSITLSYVGAAPFGGLLRRLGFLRRPGTRPLVVHPDLAGEPLRTRAFDPARWFMLDGDLDI
jgi:hypothetical protein